MLLQPRKFKYKTIFKLRKINKVYKNNKLLFGQGGLKIIKPLQLNSKKIFRLKIFLKKAVRRSDKTRRKMFFNAFPYLPLSKKNLGSRMGKGKGKLSSWKCNLSPGHILVEFENLRNGRMFYFFKQLQFKLKTPTKFIVKNTNKLMNQNSLSFKKNVSYQSFW